MALPFALTAPSLIPAVVACIAFFVVELLMIYRAIQTRGFEPYTYLCTFGLIRAIAYATRAAWSQEADPTALTPTVYVAEILSTAGFVIVLFAEYGALAQWVQHGLRRGEASPLWESRFFRIARAATLLFQILSIVATVKLLDVKSLEEFNNAQTLRYAATYGLFAVGIVHLLLTAAYFGYFVSLGNERPRVRHFVTIMGISVMATIELVYKIVVVTSPATAAINSQEAYLYGLAALPEFVIMVWSLVFNLAELKMEKMMPGDAEIAMSRRG
ncbi:hypothetical protein BC938DRAFT_480161 [Jimgerdemannia flammicorona]|uniref:Uncharacterized protein n=1 Tax=Jimgerdemannia flammicorona TaxID=994334 RepID=A0A433QXJ0_9FUNG|nr:hypothetical protein BC938DRAFT_480161 [Jimgerdemannia flammicorona]